MTAEQVKKTAQSFARFGYASKGLVYMLIGAIAVGAALGSGRAGDSREAMSSLRDKPFGKTLLAVIGVGLLAYAVWRIYSGLANPEHDKARKRVSYVLTGLINGALAIEAIRVGVFQANGTTGNQAPHWTAQVLAQPFGRWLVIAVGLGFAGYGIGRIRKAVKSRLDDQLRLGELKADTRRWVVGLARLGIGARGIVFGVIGFFLIKAGVEHDPSEARDLGATLREVQDQPFGQIMLAAVGAGLILYGFYNLVRARYRVINP